MAFRSKLVACVGLSTVLVAPAFAEPARTGVAPVFARPGPSHFQRFGAGGAGRFRRFGGYGDGYIGAAGAALATAGYLGDGYGAPSYDALPPGAVAPPEPPPIPPQPACPMIIKVGPGLEHPVRTQVIYGAPACD